VPAAPLVVPYDPAWPEAFQLEADRLHAALADVAHRIEHIGSTAVVGLAAKPVIDVMVGLVDFGDFDQVRDALEVAGYAWDPAAVQDEPARQVFRKGAADPALLRTHHLHLTREGGVYWRRILAFRDQLRRAPGAAAEYAAVKTHLLETCGGDSRAYTRGKHEVVKQIERAAGVGVQ
jgi:GrpB-like predicted nucleotidyltransferase (UPF0157 family)